MLAKVVVYITIEIWYYITRERMMNVPWKRIGFDRVGSWEFLKDIADIYAYTSLSFSP